MDREWNGGKFPNSGKEGMALDEFVEPLGVNSRDTAPVDSAAEARVTSSRPIPWVAVGAAVVAGIVLGRSIR